MGTSATDRSLIKASIGGTLTGDVSAIDSDIILTAGSVIGNLYAEDDSPASITADVGNVTGSVTAVNTGAKITLTADTVTGSPRHYMEALLRRPLPIRLWEQLRMTPSKIWRQTTSS